MMRFIRKLNLALLLGHPVYIINRMIFVTGVWFPFSEVRTGF